MKLQDIIIFVLLISIVLMGILWFFLLNKKVNYISDNIENNFGSINICIDQ